MKIKLYFGKKNIPIFILTLVVLIYVMVTSVDGIKYFFSKAEPKDLGDAITMDTKVFSELQDGDFVQIKGITSIHGGSLNKGFLSDKYYLFYLAGSSKFIIIEKVDEKNTESGPQFRTIKGRVHSFKTNKYASKMKDFFSKSFMIEMNEDGFLIESGMIPGKDYTPVIMFATMLLLLALSIFLFIKSLKTDKETMENDPDEI
ncbi:MAG TPA: hypothetical protein PKG52_12745 [bacterium]|nr:hypothetical protein [bacterium]HPS29030.1 hypothetical protein [bacterium]